MAHEVRWCTVCRVWWTKRRWRQWCPVCHELLIEKPRPIPLPEIRPGVRAQWAAKD